MALYPVKVFVPGKNKNGRLKLKTIITEAEVTEHHWTPATKEELRRRKVPVIMRRLIKDFYTPRSDQYNGGESDLGKFTDS